MPFNEAWQAARQSVKENTLVMLYMPGVDDTRRMPSFRAMEALFPNISDFILRQKDGTSNFACNMHRWDSLIMIDRAAKSLINKFPDQLFLSVHDSIHGPPDLAEEIDDAIRDACQEYCIRPTLKREAMCSDCLVYSSSKKGPVTCGECGRQITW